LSLENKILLCCLVDENSHNFIDHLYFRANFDISSEYNFDDDDDDVETEVNTSYVDSELMMGDGETNSASNQQSLIDNWTSNSRDQLQSYVPVRYFLSLL